MILKFLNFFLLKFQILILRLTLYDKIMNSLYVAWILGSKQVSDLFLKTFYRSYSYLRARVVL